MMNIEKYMFAKNLDEAYQTLKETEGSTVLGGCGYLRMGNRRITTAIDLSGLDLDFINETDDELEIGAMTSLRLLETSEITKRLFGGVLSECVKDIVGVQLRNAVTVGGTFGGRYPFSDVLTAFMSLDTYVCFADSGKIALVDYMEGKPVKDIIEKIIVKKDGRNAVFKSVRNSKTDYAILNVAVSAVGNKYNVVVGARPAKAVRCYECETFLDSCELDEKAASEAGKIVSGSVSFGENFRSGAEYRKAVSGVLVKRALLEVKNAG